MECPVCFHNDCGAYLFRECGHSTCPNCIIKIKETSVEFKCPICRVIINTPPLLIQAFASYMPDGQVHTMARHFESWFPRICEQNCVTQHPVDTVRSFSNITGRNLIDSDTFNIINHNNIINNTLRMIHNLRNDMTTAVTDNINEIANNIINIINNNENNNNLNDNTNNNNLNYNANNNINTYNTNNTYIEANNTIIAPTNEITIHQAAAQEYSVIMNYGTCPIVYDYTIPRAVNTIHQLDGSWTFKPFESIICIDIHTRFYERWNITNRLQFRRVVIYIDDTRIINYISNLENYAHSLFPNNELFSEIRSVRINRFDGNNGGINNSQSICAHSITNDSNKNNTRIIVNALLTCRGVWTYGGRVGCRWFVSGLYTSANL